ncbi:uncharacterized protein [Asterias amurensis]|uniref:uncharacterized protein isoform X2 n=1 Tax=Asterias amurensis TaxID=7602 RepID=UPI003AB30169
MRTFVFLAALTVAWGASIRMQWDEWETDLSETGPTTPIETTRPNVCTGYSRDGSQIQVCCDGYTGTIEEGCTTPICNTPCENGGTCGKPNTCECLDAFTGTYCESLKKNYRWSEWTNYNPKTDIGDSEDVYILRRDLDVCKSSVPQAIECQTLAGIDSSRSGQVVTCDRRVGLRCKNEDQPLDEQCEDYRIRVLCPVKDEETKGARTCSHKAKEYDPEEIVKEGDCLACICQTTGRWSCYSDEDYCDTAISTTPSPVFPWLPKGVQPGQCIVGETVFHHGERTTLDCKTCTCDSTSGWICTETSDPNCLASRSDDYCRIGQHFIFFHGQTAKKDCNTCICKNSEWDCTQTICPDKTNKAPYYLQCTNPIANTRHDDGEILKRDCNICVCTRGKWDCTTDTCETGTSTEDETTLATRKVCNTQDGLPYPHGATITQDCNACKCFDGKWQCTRRYCSPEIYPMSVCVDVVTGSLLKSGQTIKRGCDVCLCNSGNLTCTTKPCTTNTGVCFDEQRRFTTTSSVFERQYRPVCNNDGTFRQVQCNPLHRVCFCVTRLGQIIPGTTVKQDISTPNCSPYMANVFEDYRHFILPEPETQMETHPCITSTSDQSSQLTGYNTPKCLLTGYYAPRQCDVHIGICYCVTPEGKTIPGTIMHVSQGRPNCEEFRVDRPGQMTSTDQLTRCQDEREKAELFRLPFKPTCEDDGTYRPLQVNPLTNVRFCVDVNGVILEWTITKTSTLDCQDFRTYVHHEVKPFTAQVDHDQNAHRNFDTFPIKNLIHKTPRCHLQQLISEHVPTVYRPTCETDGRFTPEQCPEGTSRCFCVDVTGTIVPETIKRRGVQTPDCETYRSLYAVVTKTNTTTITIQPTMSLIHNGWDPLLINDVQPDNVVGKQYKPVTWTLKIKKDVTTCIRQQQIAKVVPGVFNPACQRNGTFNTMQYRPLSQTVYCVDKNGVEIEGTEGTMDCTKYWNTTLEFMQITRHWSKIPVTSSTKTITQLPLNSLFPAGLHHHPNCTKQQELTSRIKGAVVPTCEPSGTYTPLQCNATTGVCYCMLSYGDVLPDTVLPMVKGTPYCWHLRNESLQRVTTQLAEVCRKPTVKGPCRGRFVRWTFSTLLNKCTMFVYGGCRGNENQYESQEECESMCGHLSFRFDSRPLTCERKLTQYHRLSFIERLDNRRPVCTPDGNYKPKQCHWIQNVEGNIEEVCECVERMSGAILPNCDHLTFDEDLIMVKTSPSPSTVIDGCINRDVEYHRGDQFFEDCNSCTCIGNNIAGCTRKLCLPGICYHLGQEATEYNRGCEICSCLGGQWDCQLKPNCDTELVSEQETVSVCTLEPGKTMRVGESYYDECNKCTCEPTGIVICQNNYCIPGHCYYEGTPYHSGDTIKQECNRCTCFGGVWQCETNTCDPYIKTMARIEGCVYNTKEYTNGQTFYDECNMCSCLGNNVTNCFKKLCNPTSCFLNGLEIPNGESSQVECNTCTCFHGFLECTEEECLIAVAVQPKDDVILDTSIKCYVDDQTYTNGQEFWKDCNQCRCYDDGQARCEEKYCTPDLCFKEGIGYRSGKILLSETHKCTCFRGGVWECEDKTEETGPPDMIDCPLTNPPIYCTKNPCDSKFCPNHPDAICVPNYCGVCLPRFYDVHGNHVTC